MPVGRVRAAHIALAVAFVGLGAFDGVWVARLPALKHRLGLDSGELGLVILAVTLTATISLPRRGLARLAPRKPRAGRSRLGGRGDRPRACRIRAVARGAHPACMRARRRTRDPRRQRERARRRDRAPARAPGALGAARRLELRAAQRVGDRRDRGRRRVSARDSCSRSSRGVRSRSRSSSVPRLLPGSEDSAVDTARFALPRGALALPAFLTFLLHLRGVGDDELGGRVPLRAGAHERGGCRRRRRGVRDRDDVRPPRRRPLRHALGRRRSRAGRRAPHPRGNAARHRDAFAGAVARRLRLRRRGLRGARAGALPRRRRGARDLVGRRDRGGRDMPATSAASSTVRRSASSRRASG